MKKLLSIFMSICIVTSLFTSAYAVEYGKELENVPTKNYGQRFSDVPESYWAFSYISEMSERGVLSGYPDGKFYPDSQVTRAEFAKIMTTAAGLSVTNPTIQLFSDVQITDWYAPYVHTAKDYLSAYTQNGANYYLPTTPALREDIAVALVKLKGYSTTGADLSMLERMFSDYYSISDGAKIYVATAIENGLISGYDDGTFRGQNGVTRAEAATLLWRAYQYGNVNKTYDNINIYENQDKEMDIAVTEVQKPYTMKTLIDVELETPGTSTTDNENLYYVHENGCVYQTNIYTGNNVKYFDSSTIKPAEIALDGKEYARSSAGLECTLDSYVPYQVFYDEKYDRLLLSGYYKLMYQGLDSSENKYCVIHDITNGKAELIGFLDSWEAEMAIHAVLSEYEFLMSPYVAGGTVTYGLSFNFKNKIYSSFKDVNYMSYFGTIRNGNFLYSLKSDMGIVYVVKCDASSNKFETVTKGNINWYAVTNDCYYFIENNNSTGISKFNAREEKISKIAIDFSNDIYSEETININDFDTRFFVIDDNTIIFYDKYMEAFRILEKN